MANTELTGEPVALVLAAGSARRFGSCKLAASAGGMSLLQRSLGQLEPLFGRRCLVVLGANAEQLAPLAAPFPTTRCEWHNRGMGCSLAWGVSEAVRQFAPRALLVALADQVAVQSADYRKLLDASLGGQRLACAGYNASASPGRTDSFGVPAVFPQNYFKALETLDGDRGARGLLGTAQETPVVIPIAAAARDIDTPAQLEAFRATLQQG